MCPDGKQSCSLEHQMLVCVREKGPFPYPASGTVWKWEEHMIRLLFEVGGSGSRR